MESRRLEIVLHSAMNLGDVKVFGTMDPYATVWIDSGKGQGMVPKVCKTVVAKKAGSSPVWECPMQFEGLPMNNNYTLFCEIQHDGKLFDRKIGEVEVPFSNLLAGDGSSQKARYPVKNESGEVRGEIILSHKFSEPVIKNDGSETKPVNVSCASDEKVIRDGSGRSNGSSGSGKSRPKKKKKKKVVQGKKKNGFVKRVAKSVGTKLAAQGVMLVLATGVLAAGYVADEEVQTAEGEDEVQEEDEEDHVVQEEDEDEEDDDYDEDEEDDDDYDDY